MATSNPVSEQNALFEELRDGALPHTTEVVEKDNVVMNRDGSFSFADSTTRHDVLRRKRKELVLGLNGFEEHSLQEANEVICANRGSCLSRIRDLFSRRKS